MKDKAIRKSDFDIIEFLLLNKTLCILILLCIFAGIASPKFLVAKNLMNVVRQVSVSGIIGVAFTLVLASATIDLSVGYMLGMIGVISATLSKDGVPFAWVVICALLIGVLAGAINGSIVTYMKLPGFVVTLATGQIFKGIDYIVCNTSTVTGLSEEFRIIGQGYLFSVPVPVYIMVTVAIIMGIVLNMLPIGRRIIAIGGNSEAARVSGINVNSTRMFVYMLLGVCAGLGALVQTGRTFCAQPDAGFGMEMDIIAAVVIGGTPLSGGIGKVGGTVFGCLIVGVINNILNLMGVNSNWQLVAKGILILFAILMDAFSICVMSTRQTKE